MSFHENESCAHYLTLKNNSWKIPHSIETPIGTYRLLLNRYNVNLRSVGKSVISCKNNCKRYLIIKGEENPEAPIQDIWTKVRGT